MTLTEIEKLANVVVDTTREEDASNLASHTLTLCKLVKVQREALEFYANERSWTVWPDTTRGRGGIGGQMICPADIEHDQGSKAKAALAIGDALGAG